MNTAFLGTPAAAVPSLAALAGVGDVRIVITQPDRPKGRSKRPVPPPVKTAAMEWGFEVAQPETATDLHEVIVGVEVDVALVVAYGRIIRPPTLAAVEHGFVNVHFSLLPRWRGAAPVERAILAGDEITGVSLMVLEEGLDTGPVLGAFETEIGEWESAGQLTARLSVLGADLVTSLLVGFCDGDVEAADQFGGAATVAPKVTPAEARIDATLGVDDIIRMVRAFHPRPGASLFINGERLGVLYVAGHAAQVPCGEIHAVEGAAVLGVGDGALELIEVRPAGKSSMPGRAWMNGRRREPAVVDEAL